MKVEIDNGDEIRRELDVRVGLGLSASDDQLNQLLSIARPLELAAGEVLYTRDAPLTRLYQLTSGELEMEAPGLPTWRLVDNGAAGLVDFMMRRPYTRTAVAATASRALQLDVADYRDYLEDNFDVCHRVIAQLSGSMSADILASPEPQTFLGQRATGTTPTFAKVEMAVVDRLTFLMRTPGFAGASVQALANLAQSAAETRYDAGAVIASAGSKPRVVSVLVAGQVELELSPQTRISRAGTGFVAHAAELTTAPREFSVLAKSPCVVLQFDREELLDQLEEHFDLAMMILAYLAGEQEKVNNVAAAAGLPLGTSWGQRPDDSAR